MNSGTFTTYANDQKIFTVSIGATLGNNTYQVVITPGNAVSIGAPAGHYVTNKTTTAFDVVFPLGVSQTVLFDWHIMP